MAPQASNEVQHSISQSSSHRFGACAWHLLCTYDLTALSTSASAKREKVSDIIFASLIGV